MRPMIGGMAVRTLMPDPAQIERLRNEGLEPLKPEHVIVGESLAPQLRAPQKSGKPETADKILSSETGAPHKK
ncbi:MAG: hypothetical protein WB676_25190 [Bryobacteraceae bacterium]